MTSLKRPRNDAVGQGETSDDVDFMMSAGAWTVAKFTGVIQPAGQSTPGPEVWMGEHDPDAPLFKDWSPEGKWTDGIQAIAGFAQRNAERSVG